MSLSSNARRFQSRRTREVGSLLEVVRASAEPKPRSEVTRSSSRTEGHNVNLGGGVNLPIPRVLMGLGSPASILPQKDPTRGLKMDQA
jgi:hypothetical protein